MAFRFLSSVLFLYLLGDLKRFYCDRDIFEIDVIQNFAETSLRDHPLLTASAVRSIKVAEFFRRTAVLDTGIAAHHPNGSDWKRRIEGNTLAYYHKITRLSELADDSRVQTICEIGFNCGYSALNFLTANPVARFFSFDLFANNYVPAAAVTLHEMFPGRNMAIVAGSSLLTVPKMAPTLAASQSLCNLIFIDGGHEAEVLKADIYNMVLLANKSFNRFVVRFSTFSRPCSLILTVLVVSCVLIGGRHSLPPPQGGVGYRNF